MQRHSVIAAGTSIARARGHQDCGNPCFRMLDEILVKSTAFYSLTARVDSIRGTTFCN
jgi:hypothetical protein